MAIKKSKQFDLDEIYRGLRTNIEFSKMDENNQVINVVSTYANEGKTTVAMNLARILAAKYKKVLLIDCDLRNPSIHKRIHISNRIGLSNIVANYEKDKTIDDYEGIQDYEFPTKESLYVIPTGHKVPNPSEILGSQRLGAFIDEARKHYSYIVLDSCPLMISSDAIPVSNLADSTLYVVDSQNSDKRKVKSAISDFERNGGKILGVVLNKVEDVSDEIYGYGYGYGESK